MHHIIPFHLAPDLELEEDNFIVLCEHGRFKGINCHLLIGHLGNYSRFNASVKIDSVIWKYKLIGE